MPVEQPTVSFPVTLAFDVVSLSVTVALQPGLTDFEIPALAAMAL
ncbi:hypothetical protein Misp01_79100 [Microtetraspora sp. NBRC 13810]|nr:hypothetical protein Misp01_79100 [Microtetraspora sp. NBRC 13810]